eukprot:scaffold808_cov194-Pinguiococcus_pyrenoidosus.AAC.5
MPPILRGIQSLQCVGNRRGDGRSERAHPALPPSHRGGVLRMRILVPTVVLLCQVHAAQASEVLLQQLETVGYQLDIGLLQMLDEVLFALEQEGGRVGRGSALQLGCGTGIYADYLKSGSRRVKRRVICVDPEPKFGVFKVRGNL